MGDIRTSALGVVPFGTSDTRPSSPSIGQTFYNGTLGVQEIYTSSGWLPATGANDFNVTLNGPVTTATFTKEYFAGAYTIASALLDSSYDIYVYDTAGNQVGYTKSPSLSATGNFNKIVVIGGSSGDLLSFSYKTTFTASNTTSQVTAGAFITSATPTALNSIDDTTVITGGNFASNVAVYFVGSDSTERAAKSVVRSSSSSLIVTRPDDFPTNLGTYKIIVENPGITRPTGSSLHILNNAVTAGTTPNWTTATTLPEVGKNIAYSTTLVATDTEGTDIDYSVISGSLPSGITINNETGVLSGTYAGSDFNTTNLVVRAVDTGGNTVDRTFTIFSSNPVWTTSTLPGYVSGFSYSTSLVATDNSSVSYSVNSGSLPSGITLNSSTGVLSGTGPSGNTSYSFVIRATDSVGNYSDRSFTISNAMYYLSSNLKVYVDAASLTGSGAWDDLSGNSNSFTLATGTRPSVVTKSGVQAMQYNNSGYWQTSGVPNNLSLNGGTISFWMYAPGTIGTRTGWFEQRNNNGPSYTGALAITYETAGNITFYRYNNSYQDYNAPIFQTDRWIHVTLVLTAGTLSGSNPQIKTYFDGVNQNVMNNSSSSTNTNLNSLGALVLGSGYAANTPMPNGWLSAFRAWNIELTPSQVLEDYNNTKARYGR